MCCCVKCNWKQQFTVNFFKWKLLHRYCLKFFTIQCINSVFYYTNTVFNFFSSVDSKFKCNLFELFDNFVSAGRNTKNVHQMSVRCWWVFFLQYQAFFGAYFHVYHANHKLVYAIIFRAYVVLLNDCVCWWFYCDCLVVFAELLSSVVCEWLEICHRVEAFVNWVNYENTCSCMSFNSLIRYNTIIF